MNGLRWRVALLFLVLVFSLRQIFISLSLHMYAGASPPMMYELWKEAATNLSMTISYSSLDAKQTRKRDKSLHDMYMDNVPPLKSYPTFVHPPKGYQFLMQQPFYVYDDLVWLEDATLDGQTIQQRLEAGYADKHADDLWFMASALSHPMRTANPAQAQLFVVPSLASQILSRDVQYCYRGICQTDLLLDMIELVLEGSPWFQRSNGADHVMVATHFLAPQVLPLHRTLLLCHMIVMENRNFNDPDRFMLPSYYMGNPCPPLEENNGGLPRKKTADFVQVASLKLKFTTFQSRRDICQWLARNRSHNVTVEVCGQGRQCPALAAARYGFHARGDTYGANRLMDTILSETVPIFTQVEQYDVLPDWIDWHAISVFANVSNRDAFLRDVDGLVSPQVLESQYETKLATIRANRDLLEWRNGLPFDTYMYMLWWHLQVRRQGHVVPATTSSPYSILKLPQDAAQAPLRAFDSRSKNVWCGPHNGPAPSCAECPRMAKIPPTRTCMSMCRWCPHGGSVENLLAGDETPCVPFHHSCR